MNTIEAIDALDTLTVATMKSEITGPCSAHTGTSCVRVQREKHKRGLFWFHPWELCDACAVYWHVQCATERLRMIHTARKAARHG